MARKLGHSLIKSVSSSEHRTRRIITQDEAEALRDALRDVLASCCLRPDEMDGEGRVRLTRARDALSRVS